MVDVPAIEPVTTPVVGDMVALPLLLLHVPPAGVEFKVVVKPTQTLVVPVIVVGFGFTVTTAVTDGVQPVEYEIVAVPARLPVTTPVNEPTLAVAEALLLHVPPVTASVKLVTNPTHTESAPNILPGAAVTVTTIVAGVPQLVE